VPPAFNLSNVQKLKLARFVHGGSQQELESLLDVGSLGVEEGGQVLEFRGKILDRGFHDLVETFE
jgi:hypothetical protein